MPLASKGGRGYCPRGEVIGVRVEFFFAHQRLASDRRHLARCGDGVGDDREPDARGVIGCGKRRRLRGCRVAGDAF